MKIKNNVDVNRRRALIGGAAGVGLAAWHKPMIESVLLPAHAQTSMVTPTVFFVAGINAGPLVTQNNFFLDFLVPQAVAGGEIQERTTTLTIRVEDTSGDLTAFSVGLFTRVTGIKGFEAVESVHKGDVTVASGGTLMATEVPCEAVEVEDIDVEIVSVDGTLVSLRLLGFDLVLDAPAEDMPLPTAVCTPLSFGDYQLLGDIADNNTLLDVLVPQALAGVPTNGVAVLLQEDIIAINSGDNINFTVTYQNGINRWSGSLVAGAASPSPLSIQEPACGEEAPLTINARIASVSPIDMDLRVDHPLNPMAQFYLDPTIMPSLPPLDNCDAVD